MYGVVICWPPFELRMSSGPNSAPSLKMPSRPSSYWSTLREWRRRSVARYCCFFCPTGDFDESALQDKCPTCAREFGFPLFNTPVEIGQYRIIRPLGRGFYAATYVAERKEGLRSRSVLKVTPKSFYDVFPDKDFAKECQLHDDVAQGTEHLVKIREMFEDLPVSFGDQTLSCCVAVLDY